VVRQETDWDVHHRELPRAVQLLPRREFLDGEVLAAVDAVMQSDLLGPSSLDGDLEGDPLAREDLGQIGVIARLNAHGLRFDTGLGAGKTPENVANTVRDDPGL
jgi:hypothetical protein